MVCRRGFCLKANLRHALLALAVPSFLLPACVCDEPQHLRLGMMSSAGCSPLRLAAQQKFFARQGLQVEFKTFESRAEATKAFTRQAYDLLCLNLIELITLPEDYKVILVPAASSGADVLIARRDAGSTLTALKGARIGVPPLSMGEILLTRALDQQALARDDFTVLTKEAQDLQGALQKSEIQLAVTAPPYSLEILKSPDMQIVFRSSAMPGEIIDVMAVRAELFRSLPQLSNQLASVWQDTLQYMQNEPAEAYAFLARTSGLPETTFQQDYKFLTRNEQNDFMKREGHLVPLIEQIQSSLLQAGGLKTKRESAAFLGIPTQK